MAVDKNKKKAMDAEITGVLLDDFDKFEHFAVTYWKQIGGLAVAIVVGVALWVMISDSRKATERRINDEICNAKTESEIIKIVKEYPGYGATHYARLRLAKIYLTEKKYDKAYEQFTLLRVSKIPREMTWRISLDEAYALELEGKKATAAEKFVKIGSDPSLPEDIRCEANYTAGRLYADLKKKDKARKYLTKASKIKPGINNQTAILWVSQAKFMLIRLAKPPQKIVAPKAPAKKAPAKK
jgi:tetratricopeptide (TPR) repeat protein